jgi:hypothetical protein
MLLQALFTVLIALQFVAVASHDLLDIPGWTHGSQVQAVLGRSKLWLATLVNAIFPGLAVGLAVVFWDRPRPAFVSNYWIAYCAVTVVFAIVMWYLPYVLGTTEKRKNEYARMYAGTRQVLPPRGENPRPNLLHVCGHALFLVNLFLAFLLRVR